MTAEEFLDDVFRETGFDITDKVQRSMVLFSMKAFAKVHVANANEMAKNSASDVELYPISNIN